MNANYRVAAFGEVMMRLEVPGHALLVQANSLALSFSGTGVNVTAALTNYGHEGYLVTTLPNNPLGDAAASALKKLGLSLKLSNRAGQYIGSYFLENGFGVRPSRVTYTNRQESSFNTASTDHYDFAAIAEQIDVISFCGITLAMNDLVRSQMFLLAEEMRKRGKLIVFDCNYRPSLWGKDGYEQAKGHYEKMLQLADIVMMNEKDALLLLGFTTEQVDRKEQLLDVIPQVAKRYQIPIIAGTQRTIYGDNKHELAAYMYKEAQFSFYSTEPFAVYDRIGAGDAFTSGIIHGELTKMSQQETIAFAAAAGMLAHTTAGDTPLASIAEVEQALVLTVSDVQR
ncbi:sugar kinase [Paenibacillus yanchengensis]|uniref:Sugar kinase n=1 Tax=Paenibacillus yanchengensis TaxID=2035833 RepID=A0ABW4YIG1_9BACL